MITIGNLPQYKNDALPIYSYTSYYQDASLPGCVLLLCDFSDGGNMAMMKLCKCNTVIPISEKRCRTCSDKLGVDTKERYKHYDTNRRDKEATMFYRSLAWKRMRMQILAGDNGLCVKCKEGKRITPATMVDHVIPLRIAWDRRLDPSNLQALCERCHRAKTASDRRTYGA